MVDPAILTPPGCGTDHAFANGGAASAVFSTVRSRYYDHRHDPEAPHRTRACAWRHAGVRCRCRLSARLPHRARAAGRHGDEQEFLRLRGPQQQRRHHLARTAGPGLPGLGQVRHRRRAQTTGRDLGNARRRAAFHRQGLSSDGAPGGRKQQSSQMDFGGRLVGTDRARHGADPGRGESALSRRCDPRGADDARHPRYRSGRRTAWSAALQGQRARRISRRRESSRGAR